MKKSIQIFMLVIISISILFQSKAQDVKISIPSDMTKSLPIDSKVKIGTLDNGIKYYIRANETPDQRAELRLVVNAGSILEDEDQLGLAHFCEHMAFNGTKNFEKHEIVDFMEKIGMKFGAEVNAYTSFDETVYMLTVPTDNKNFIDSGIMILADWAHNISFEDEEVDKERGVIHEEWRLGQGAQDRMSRVTFPVILNNSKYASRIPIGTMDVIDNFKYDVIKRFYKDWYRPDLMAVVAVGDFDEAEVEAFIIKHFSTIPATTNPKERKSFEIPNHDETLVAIASDKENPYSMVQMYIKHDADKEVNYNTYRQSIIDALFSSMLSNRLQEKMQEPNPPFMYAYGGYSSFLRGKDAFMLMGVAKINRVEESLEILVEETERIRRHGFTITELERQKIEMLAGIEKLYKERDKQKSINYAGEYQRNFLINESMPGIEYEYGLYQQFLPTITIEELNKLADKYVTDENNVIIITLPEKDDVKIPKEKDILKLVKKTKKKKDIAPYIDKVSDKPLIEELPTAGNVASIKEIKEIDAKEWTLSNGVKVVLKKTDFKNDEILMSAYSLGGTSLYPIKDMVSSRFADDVIDRSGLSDFDNIELEKMLAGKVVGVSPYISELEEGFTGSASPDDFETLMQLTYLYFTDARKDSKAFANYISDERNDIQNKGASPDGVFGDSIRSILSNYHPRRKALTEEMLGEADLERIFEIYKERFADASDFTFFFVGNFDEETIKPMIEKYLGSLPSTNSKETWKDLGIREPKGKIEKTVYKGVEPKATVFLSFNGDYKYDPSTILKMNAMVDVLNIRLRENIREDQSGVYNISAWVSNSHYPDESYNIGVYFGCAPENVDKLVNSVYEEIKKLQTEGSTAINIEKVKETMIRTRETQVNENRFWLSTLKSSYYNNTDFNDFDKYNEKVKAINNDVVKEMANKYFDFNNMVKVVLMPETEKK